jgi:transcriptional regulator with XRE-family HTH domain
MSRVGDTGYGIAMTVNRGAFAARLKKARRMAQLKQEQIARYLEVPVSAVSAMESGTRRVDVLELYMLSRLYNKPLDWFLEEYFLEGAPLPTSTEGVEPALGEAILRLRQAPRQLQREVAFHILTILSRE